MNERAGITLGEIVSSFDTEEKVAEYFAFLVNVAAEESYEVIDRKDLLLPLIKDYQYNTYAVLLPFLFYTIAGFVAKGDMKKHTAILNMLQKDSKMDDDTIPMFVVVGIFEILLKLTALNENKIKKGGAGYVNVQLKWFAMAVYSSYGIAKEVRILPLRKDVFEDVIDKDGKLGHVLDELQNEIKHTQEVFGAYNVNNYWDKKARQKGQSRLVIKDWILV